MQEVISENTNFKFWWLRHDSGTYKVPYAGDEILFPDDYLRPDFVINPKRHWYKFGSDREDPRKTGDFSGFIGSALFVNERAYEAFEDLLSRSCRSLPVLCNGRRHYIVAVDSKHDPIDMQRSEFLRISSYVGPAENGISKVNKIVLNPGFSTEDDIFRIDRGPALNLQLIVSDRFKLRYDESGLTGLFFKEVMP